MAIRLESPPVREPMVDKNGNITPNWARWMTLLHAKTGGSAEALPVSLGGSGATNAVQAIANQTASAASGGGSTSNALTQRKTFVLNSPEQNVIGDVSDTVCIWDVAFPNATYTVTGIFSGGAGNGTISISNVTTKGFTVRLTNTRNRQASGTADCIGVHP